ncbi:Histidine kinase-, DNA gyrase B-, and HSP90-like ATPase [Granulicella rosea]|uniref:histidine kinase n=2 Tax=Granulicella rosea TaxID=474952 RepID=A0A239EF03_9BACT|nr:HAMP domain-containing sensor histidine kinase [Granulicella rosea]SNS42484.1 Histidine kinase-, DNA gyrase B-, and HSP90-like ATPase [Granulicella rosea]
MPQAEALNRPIASLAPDSWAALVSGLLQDEAVSPGGVEFYRDKNRDASQVFDSRDAIEHIVQIYSSRMATKSVNGLCCLEDNLPLRMAKGDFQQVISNLISNTIDACSRNGTIHIDSYTYEHSCIFTVSDSGGGVPVSILDRIFTLFFTTNQDVSTGPGLWVTRDIVEKYHGTTAVENRTEGAEFKVVLPGAILAS